MVKTKTVQGFRGMKFPLTIWEDPDDEILVTSATPPKTRVFVAGHERREDVILEEAFEAGSPSFPHGGVRVYNKTTGQVEAYYFDCVVLHPSVVEDAHLYFGASEKKPKWHRRTKSQKERDDAVAHLSERGSIATKKRGRPRKIAPLGPEEPLPPPKRARRRKNKKD